MELKDFTYGGLYRLYGVDGDAFKVRYVGSDNPRVFRAVEDPDDGLRSYLDALIEVTAPAELARYVFPSRYVATVRPRWRAGGDDVVEFVEADGDHVWLEIGTDQSDDLYPYYVFTWHPKEPE